MRRGGVHGVETAVSEYRSDSLAAEEVLTLANWCLLHDAGDSVRRGACDERPFPVAAYSAG